MAFIFGLFLMFGKVCGIRYASLLLIDEGSSRFSV